MIRTMDAAFLNTVANDPNVRPWLGGEGEIDLSGILRDPRNIGLQFEHGGFVLTRHQDGVYESHTLFRPGAGAEALDTAREGLRYLFTATDAFEVVTRVPDSNPAAKGFARAVGFDAIFHRDACWSDGGGVGFHVLSLDRWRARDPEIAGVGHAFHEQIEAAKAASGSPLPVHPDDEAHDRAVGASVLMIHAGQAQKGVGHYNKWARLAGYEPIHLLSEAPPVIDVIDAVVTLRAGVMEVLTCR